jgi:signal recognition particle subunit SRP72
MSSAAKGHQISTTPGHKQHKKAPPRPPLPKDERIKRLAGSLCSQLDGEHFENAIKTCNKCNDMVSNYRQALTNLSVIALDPDDKDALQTKLWLLFKTNAYPQALDVAQSRPGEFHFERAYALYRLQRETEAADVLAGLGEAYRAAALLQAQIVSCSLNSLGITDYILTCVAISTG